MIRLISDVKYKARSISNIIAALPFTSNIKKSLFDLTVGMLKGTIQLDTAIDELAKLRIVLDNTMEQSSHQMILDEAQRNLKNFLDDIWNIVDVENMTDLHDIIVSIRNIFNSLFFLIQEQDKKLLN